MLKFFGRSLFALKQLDHVHSDCSQFALQGTLYPGLKDFANVTFVAISLILFQMRHDGRLRATFLRMKYECLLLLLYTN